MMSSRSRSSHSVRAAVMNSWVAGWTPASPWMGSSRIAATEGSMALVRASTSFQATCRKPSGRGWNGSCFSGWPVAASDPIVRPWKLP